MNKITKLSFSTLLTAALCCACVETPIPTSYLLPEQVKNMAPEESQEKMLSGIVAFVNDYSTWSSSDQYYTQDWGYPCQMFYREVLGSDIPIGGSGVYNYWINVEKNTSLTGAAYYTYYYYYRFIKECNNLIGLIDPATASESSRRYLGCALAFRAMCYMDLARMFEFLPTGYEYYDDQATQLDIWGLTVPIVTDKTPDEKLNKNPRAPFTTMYRFILSDLNLAEELLTGYNRPGGNYPDQSVVYGLQARLWLEMATRFSLERTTEQAELSAKEWKEQMALEGKNDGYANLGVTTTQDCYQKAADYARRAQKGYTPTSEADWKNPTTGFNTATTAWMLFNRVSTQEQECNYYSSMLGVVTSEATWGMAQYGGGNYRCIGDWLYDKIDDADWRKQSWLNPDDALTAATAIKIKDKQLRAEHFQPLKEKYGYMVSDTVFSRFPKYANFKFRTRDVNDMIEGLKCDLPLMRVEEMYFIEAEAEAHLNGIGAGASLLQAFVTNHRYTQGTYDASTTDMDQFNEKLMIQKRIEFWGEGICYFDYKRLRLPVRRSENSNYPNDMRLYNSNKPMDSKDGYVCPSMNYYILIHEINNNPAVVPNPDCSKWYEKK